MSQSATVMTRHLKRKHLNLYEELQKKNSDFKNENMAMEPKRQKPGSSMINQLKIEQVFKPNQGYGEHSARQKMLDRSAALALCIPHMSINLFTHPLVQNFVNALDPKYKFPTSFHGLRSLMDDPVKELKKRVKREIAGF
ncbi:hypothetical protein Ddc_15478 [Ditylenchus destructor]|nr:hypothetical protein Ddc_15478 [Ditylenchus destructor]